MKFIDALELLKQGKKIKLPSWSGYWVKEDDTVKMYCKDGRVLDIRESEDVFYTLSNIASEDWKLAEDEEIHLDVHTFTFGEAIRRLKAGQKVARKGWNGKGMFVVYRTGYPEGIPANKNTADAIGIPEGTLFKVGPYLQMKCVDGSFQMWLASQSDMLAEDWFIVE